MGQTLTIGVARIYLQIVTASERRLTSERGASLVEYALLVAFIAIVCIAAVTALGRTTNAPYSSVSSTIAG